MRKIEVLWKIAWIKLGIIAMIGFSISSCEKDKTVAPSNPNHQGIESSNRTGVDEPNDNSGYMFRNGNPDDDDTITDKDGENEDDDGEDTVTDKNGNDDDLDGEDDTVTDKDGSDEDEDGEGN